MAAYGVVVYVLFLVVFAYFIGWVEGLVVTRSIDRGPSASSATAIVVDVIVLAVFAGQHSVMARPAFKRRWARIVPAPIERSTYVLLSTAALALAMWQWRPLPDTIWDVGPSAARVVLRAVSFCGWGMALLSTFLIDHFDMFGLRQVLRHHAGAPQAEPTFATPVLYRIVRHPLYLGFLIAFWAAPSMTRGRLLFAVVTSAYILLAVRFEEHDLMTEFGEQYRSYRTRTPMLIPGRAPRD